MVSIDTEPKTLCEKIPGQKAQKRRSLYMQATGNSKLVHYTNATQTME